MKHAACGGTSNTGVSLRPSLSVSLGRRRVPLRPPHTACQHHASFAAPRLQVRCAEDNGPRGTIKSGSCRSTQCACRAVANARGGRPCPGGGRSACRCFTFRPPLLHFSPLLLSLHAHCFAKHSSDNMCRGVPQQCGVDGKCSACRRCRHPPQTPHPSTFSQGGWVHFDLQMGLVRS